jgi:hypothetical protein
MNKNILKKFIQNEIKMWRTNFEKKNIDVYKNSDESDYVLGDEDTLKLSKEHNPYIVEPYVAEKIKGYWEDINSYFKPETLKTRKKGK